MGVSLGVAAGVPHADHAVEELVHRTRGLFRAAIKPPAQERQQAARERIWNRRSIRVDSGYGGLSIP
jgi:hypothetical protein